MLLEYTTNRLLLRVLDETYAKPVLDFYQRNRDIFHPYEPLVSENFYTLAYQEAALKAEFTLFLRASSLRYYLFDITDQTTIIGTICLYHILSTPYNSCKLGYRLDKQAQKSGYAYEALSYLLPYFFKEYKLRRIEAEIMPENKDSLLLIERLGFSYEGISRSCCEIAGERKDHFRYSLISSDLMPYSPTPQNLC